MGIQVTPLAITTVLVLAFTVWMIVGRFRASADSNWPLFYYLGIVIYSYVYPGFLDTRMVYVGAIIALFLRFEFMGGLFLKIMKVAEYVVLLYLLYALLTTLII